MLVNVYGATREEFLKNTGEWVAERYGHDQ